MNRLDIQEVWMRLQALDYLRDYPRLKTLHDSIMKELEAHSLSLEPKPEQPKLVTPAAGPANAAVETKPGTVVPRESYQSTEDQAQARRETAERSANVLKGPVDPTTKELVTVDRVI